MSRENTKYPGNLGDMSRESMVSGWKVCAWAVPVSDMRGALRALYEVSIMRIYSRLHINVFLSF